MSSDADASEAIAAAVPVGQRRGPTPSPIRAGRRAANHGCYGSADPRPVTADARR